MKYNNIIFDMHNIYHRAYAVNTVQKVVINKQTMDTNGIRGSLKMIEKRIKEYLEDGGKAYFTFDNPKTSANRSKAIDPNYKAQRSEMPKSFYAGLNYLEFILRNYRDNSFVVRETSTEADDWIKPIVESFKENETCLMVSTDLDWARSLSDNVHWLDSGEVITPEIFEEYYKYKATESSVCFHKTFYGDTSDNIQPTLKQMAFSHFLKIIEEYDHASDFINDCITGKIEYLDEGWSKRVARDRSLILNNWELVSFKLLTNVDLERHTIKTRFNKLKLQVMYEALFIDSTIDGRVFDSGNTIEDELMASAKLPRK